MAVKRCTPMQSNTNGFTLIELIIVIVVLGVLAVIAAPKFISLSEEAQRASIQGLKAAIDTQVKFIEAAWRLDGSPDGNNTYTMQGFDFNVINGGLIEDSRLASWVMSMDGYSSFAIDVANKVFTLEDYSEGTPCLVFTERRIGTGLRTISDIGAINADLDNCIVP